MNAVPSSFRQLERITRPAPFGVVFWDFATGGPVADGLEVSIAPAARPESARQLFANRNSVWVATSLPGLSTPDLLAEDWDPLLRSYRIRVEDRAGRFLPLQLEAELPSRGLYHWPGWAGVPKTPITPFGKSETPVRHSPDRIPLFSAPGRPRPVGRAEVRCQLVDSVGGTEASWALVTAKHGTMVRGIGMADRKGRAVLYFGYPERPAPTLATATAIDEYQWDLKLQGYYDPADGDVPDIPELGTVMGQLDHPRQLLDSTVAPIEQLPNQTLTYRRELVVRTRKTAEGPSSSLFMAAE